MLAEVRRWRLAGRGEHAMREELRRSPSRISQLLQQTRHEEEPVASGFDPSIFFDDMAGASSAEEEDDEEMASDVDSRGDLQDLIDDGESADSEDMEDADTDGEEERVRQAVRDGALAAGEDRFAAAVAVGEAVDALRVANAVRPTRANAPGDDPLTAEPRAGESLLVVHEPFLSQLLAGQKVEEIRGSGLAAGRRLLGRNGYVHGVACFGDPEEITSIAEYRERLPRHRYDQEELPYPRTWALPVLGIRQVHPPLPYDTKKVCFPVAK